MIEIQYADDLFQSHILELFGLRFLLHAF